jgi:hypothetical protein
MVKSKLHKHAALVDLIGPSKIARTLNALKKSHNRTLTPQAVSKWRKKGVSIWFRHDFARLLIREGHAVPAGFVEGW